MVHVEMSMASAVKLVVNLENPGRYVEILGNKLGQRVDELLLIININTAYRGWNISQLKYLLGSRLGRIEVLFRRFSTKNRNC